MQGWKWRIRDRTGNNMTILILHKVLQLSVLNGLIPFFFFKLFLHFRQQHYKYAEWCRQGPQRVHPNTRAEHVSALWVWLISVCGFGLWLIPRYQCSLLGNFEAAAEGDEVGRSDSWQWVTAKLHAGQQIPTWHASWNISKRVGFTNPTGKSARSECWIKICLSLSAASSANHLPPSDLPPLCILCFSH